MSLARLRVLTTPLIWKPFQDGPLRGRLHGPPGSGSPVVVEPERRFEQREASRRLVRGPSKRALARPSRPLARAAFSER
jgi:hypothetical protein